MQLATVRRIMIGLALLIVTCVGCSEDDVQPNEDALGLPACADVWQAGDTLPDGYIGCDMDGSRDATGYDCTDPLDADSFLFVHESLYAVRGDVIRLGGANDLEFNQAALSCAVGSGRVGGIKETTLPSPAP